MKRWGWVLLSLWVLFCYAWALAEAMRNRSEVLGSIEMTERELPLSSAGEESTALIFRLHWNRGLGAQPKEHLDWLDAAKLTELGFQCSLPAEHPDAGKYYGGLLPREVFVALEYEGEAWKRWGAADDLAGSRLYAVDAALTYPDLRKKYPDPRRHLIASGTVRAFLNLGRDPSGKEVRPRRLSGTIAELLPYQIYVPPPHVRLLEPFVPKGNSPGSPGSRPRYAVTLNYGLHHQPWVAAVRLLNTNQP